MIKKITFSFLLTFVAMSASTQTVLFEEKFTSGIPTTWTVFDVDNLAPNTAVSEFTNGWIGKVVGTDTSAASTSFYEPVGAANDFLITPQVTLGNFSKLVWSARSFDASFPDGYQVLISTTDSLVSSFTDTLLTVTAEQPTWKTRSIVLDLEGYANQPVYLAFQNNTNNGFILLLDNVTVLGAETASIDSEDIDNTTISLYPNPANDFLNITTNEQLTNTQIYSLDGKFQFSDNTNKLDISSLSTGLYFAVVNTTNGQYSLKFFKQ